MTDVPDLLNRASIAPESEKAELLSSAYEVLFFKDTHLLADYYRSLIEFAFDRSTVMIKKQIIGFIESTCKQYPQYLTKSKDIILFLLNQESSTIIKRTILCFTNIIRSTLSYVLNYNQLNDANEVYTAFNDIKSLILKPQNLDNESTLVNTLKMVEILVLCFSSPGDSPIKRLKSDEEFSLDRIPDQHPILNRSALQKECESYYLNLLIDHVTVLNNMTSTNIMTLVTSLTSIAKQRLGLIKDILPILCTCPSKVPRLSTVQNESIKHTLKMNLLSILKLKNNYVSPFVQDLIEALTLVDAKDHAEDAARWYRGEPEKKKRNYEQNIEGVVKKIKTEDLNNNQHEFNINNNNNNLLVPDPNLSNTILRPGLQLDPDTQQLILNVMSTLSPDFIINMVLDNMNISPLFYLLNGVRRNPNTEPLFQFVNSYQQPSPPLQQPIQHQQNNNHLQNDFNQQQQQQQQGQPPILPKRDPRVKSDSPPDQQDGQQQYIESPPPTSTIKIERDEEPDLEDHPIHAAEVEEKRGGGGGIGAIHNKMEQEEIVSPLVSPKPTFRIPTLSKKQAHSIMDRALHRMRVAEKSASQGGKISLWSSLLSRLLSMRHGDEQTGLVKDESAMVDDQQEEVNNNTMVDDKYVQTVMDFILEDFESRRELALRWLQNELLVSQEVSAGVAGQERYGRLVLLMVARVQAVYGALDERIVSAFILEIPMVDDGLITHIRECCRDPESVTLGLSTLRDLILWRPNLRDRCLDSLLEFSVDQVEIVRSTTIRVLANQLFSKPSLTDIIQRFATSQLLSMINNSNGNGHQEPDEPQEVEQEHQQFTEIENKILLFFSLCTKKPLILVELLEVYPRCSQLSKEVIIRHIGVVMKTIGQSNPDILQVLAVCPTGSEKLMIEMLTSVVNGEKPEMALVDTVKSLLKTTGETLFLLPVVHGLAREEIISHLPTFLSLPEEDLRAFVTMLATPGSPMTPSDLLVQLHLVQGCKARAVGNALDQCTQNMQSVFKQETVAVTIQQLMVQPTLSLFLIRTMINSLQNYPNLRNFIIEVMRQLVSKQVWNNKELWRGFKMIADRARPDSLPVILDLPTTQFQLALEDDNLRRHLTDFIQSQDAQSRSAFSRNNLRLLDQSNNKS